MYDAIVIGAGPCGCAAAITLSKSGHKVVLLEKYKLPRYKSCSGILIDKSIRFIEKKLGRAVPAFVTCTPVENRGMVLFDDGGKKYEFQSRGLNILRDKFDCWLVSLAKEAGAEVRDESAVTHIRTTETEAEVEVNGASIFARYAIDCTGAVGVSGVRPAITTYQTFNVGSADLDYHYFYAFLQPELSDYDAWFNVKDGMLIIGAASPDAKAAKLFHEKFTAFMVRNYGLKITETRKTDKWIMRKIAPPFDIDCGAGRLLKAGENAGFLNPMGEGISCALESGYCAAAAVSNALNGTQNAADVYTELTVETVNYMRRQWKLVGKMSDKFAYMN